MKKVLSFILLVLVALIVVFAFAKNAILEAVVENSLTHVTGFKTSLDSLHYNYPSTIQMKGLKIENPSEFKQRTFVNIPEIYVSLVLTELLRNKKIHLPEVRLDIQEVRVEKNEQGVSNIEKLTALSKTKDDAEKPAEAVKKPAMAFQLDRLELTVRKLSYEDHSNLLSKGGLPNKMEVDLNLDKEVITNINKPEALVTIIVAKILNAATLGKLLDLNVDQMLKDSFVSMSNVGTAVGKQVTGELQNVTDKAKDFLETSETAQKTEAALGEAATVVSGTAQKAKEQVSGLFSKLGAVVEKENN